MKEKQFARMFMTIVVAFFVQTSANAQLGGLLNKAKKAVGNTTEKAVGKAADKTVSSVGGGPACPWMMSEEATYNGNDYEDPKNVKAFIWNLDKLEKSDVEALRKQIDERFKYDMKLLKLKEQGTVKSGNPMYAECEKAKKEIDKWETLYGSILQMFSIVISNVSVKDGGIQGISDARYMLTNNQSGGLGAVAVGTITSECKFVDVFSSGGDKFLDAEAIEWAKKAVKRMRNIQALGYNLRGLFEETGYKADDERMPLIYNLAGMYAGVTEKAIEHNKPENIQRMARPKAGALHASLKAKALAVAKSKHSNVVDVIITSDKWDVKMKGLVISHRSVYGYYLVKDDNGTLCTPRAWTQDYMGNGKYGELREGGVGVAAEFYVK